MVVGDLRPWLGILGVSCFLCMSKEGPMWFLGGLLIVIIDLWIELQWAVGPYFGGCVASDLERAG